MDTLDLAKKISDLCVNEDIHDAAAALTMVIGWMSHSLCEPDGRTSSTQKKLQFLRFFDEQIQKCFWAMNETRESHSEPDSPVQPDKESWEKVRMDSEPQ